MSTELAVVRVEPTEVMNVTAEPDAVVDRIDLCHHDGAQQETDMKSSLVVSLEERALIERETRSQSSQQEWHKVRAKCITGSKCGRILNQK